MKLLVDDREPPELVALIAAKVPVAQSTRLSIGDFWFVAEEGDVPLVVVERKSWPDLRNSCMDGRFRSQRARMLAMFPLELRKPPLDSPVCLLLVESEEHSARSKEDWNHPQFGQMNHRCESELLRATLFHADNMRLVRTHDHKHTCRVLEWIYKELTKARPSASLESVADLEVCNRAKRARKEAARSFAGSDDSTRIDYRAALMSLKGLSLPRVLAIEAAGRSFLEWGQAYVEDPTRAVATMAAVQVSTRKKLGAVLARKVLEMLTFPRINTPAEQG